MNDDIKLLIKEIRSEKKKKYKNNDKIKQLEILLVKIKCADKPDKLEIALRKLNKIQVINENLHEIENEILLDYVGAFEMVGNLKVGDQIRLTRSRFRNIDDFVSYINSIDQDYDSEDALFNGYTYKLDTLHFIKVNRNQYGNGCDFKHEVIKYPGSNCFIPTKGYRFVKCANFLTGKDYKQQYLDFPRSEQRRSNIMTQAKIQPFCRSNNVKLGFWDGERVFPRSVTERNKTLYSYKNPFCLIWRSQGVSSNQAVKELKDNFKIVDNYITEENVNSHFEHLFKPKKIESHQTNFIYTI